MARIPKNYRGSHLTIRKLGPLLSSLVENLSTKEVSGFTGLKEVWPVIVGPEMACMTRVSSLSEEGTLFVEVKSSTLYALLSRREKPRILGAVKKRLPALKIQNICFQLGSFT